MTVIVTISKLVNCDCFVHLIVISVTSYRALLPDLGVLVSVHYYSRDEGRVSGHGCRSQVAIIAVVMCRHECGTMELGVLRPHRTQESVSSDI